MGRFRIPLKRVERSLKPKVTSPGDALPSSPTPSDIHAAAPGRLGASFGLSSDTLIICCQILIVAGVIGLIIYGGIAMLAWLWYLATASVAWLAETIAAVGHWIASTIAEGYLAVIHVIEAVINSLAHEFSAAWELAVATIKTALGAVAGLFGSIVAGILYAVHGIATGWNAIVHGISAGWTTVIAAIKASIGALGGLFGSIIDGVLSGVHRIAAGRNSIIHGASTALAIIAKAIKAVLKAVTGLLE